MVKRMRFDSRRIEAAGMVFLGLFLAASVFGIGAAPARAQDAAFCLTILHNNDGESQLIETGDETGDFGGVARFATLLRKLKLEAVSSLTAYDRQCALRGVVALSSGMNFFSGPQLNISLEKDTPLFESIALNLLDYDAMNIGNHEFDYGPDVFADFIEGMSSRYPLVSANLDFSGEPRLQALVDSGRIRKSAVVSILGERIGVVGATTELLKYVSSPRNVIAEPVIGSVQAEIDNLTAQGVNKIVFVSHLQNINEDFALISMLRGLDVMVAGGDVLLANEGNLLIPGDERDPAMPYPMLATDADGRTVPVVAIKGSYRYVGRLVIGFDEAGEIVSIDTDRSGLVRVAGGDNQDAVAPDPLVQALVVEPVEEALSELAENVIGTSEVGLDGIWADVRSKETNLGNLAADAMLFEASRLARDFNVKMPDVALLNGGAIRNDDIRGPGVFTELDTYDVLPFSSFVSIAPDVPAAQFKELLENAVSQVEGLVGRFAQVSGFSMVWDASKTPQVLDDDGNVATPGSRVIGVVLADGTPIVSNGKVVTGAPSVTIVTLDFLARGGDQYPYRGAPFVNLGVTYQQALDRYIRHGLNGSITSQQYPEGGEGRITRLN